MGFKRGIKEDDKKKTRRLGYHMGVVVIKGYIILSAGCGGTMRMKGNRLDCLASHKKPITNNDFGFFSTAVTMQELVIHIGHIDFFVPGRDQFDTTRRQKAVLWHHLKPNKGPFMDGLNCRFLLFLHQA